MILDFWYSERCTRQIKLIICISTCVVIYLSAKPAELSIWFVGFALLIGISLHLTRECILKIKSQNSNVKAIQWFIIVPIIAPAPPQMPGPSPVPPPASTPPGHAPPGTGPSPRPSPPS